ncbi:hypothetical protein SMICM304S_10882 [Streptomyces microflavus]
MCAWRPPRANCTGRTPGWCRYWNSGRRHSGGRPPRLRRTQGRQIALREPHLQRAGGLPGGRQADLVEDPDTVPGRPPVAERTHPFEHRVHLRDEGAGTGRFRELFDLRHVRSVAAIGSARCRPAEGSSERTNDGAGKGVRGVPGIHGQRRTTHRARRRGARRHGLLAVASAVVAIGATAGLIEAGQDGRRTTAVPEPTPPPVLQPLPAVPTPTAAPPTASPSAVPTTAPPPSPRPKASPYERRPRRDIRRPPPGPQEQSLPRPGVPGRPVGCGPTPTTLAAR